MKVINRDQEIRIWNLLQANHGASGILKRVLAEADESQRKDLENSILIIDTTVRGIMRALNE